MQWNRTVNLTAITDPEKVAVKHFVDALAPSPLIGDGVRILDAGSGGGFPGIPIKIMRSDVSMTLMDSVRKKVSFLKHAIRTLGLKEVHAVHGRLEDLGRSPQYRGNYDLVICRAFSSLEKFVSLAIPFSRQGGRLLALKGPQAEHGHEMPKLEEGGTVSFGKTVFYPRTVPYRLPFIDAKRSLVWLIPKVG
jgi:16S rRNA (guanine527-N7)-methyltransferase